MASTITAGNATNGLALSCDNTGILELKTGTGSGTTAMTINASQNVGVGTGSPSQKLTVVGAAASTGATSGFVLHNRATDALSISLYSPSGGNFRVYDNVAGIDRFTVDSSGNVLVLTAGGLGYGTGSGGTVTQASNKGSAVTLNKPTGQITMNNAALAANTTVAFSFSNSLLSATDTLIINIVNTSIANSTNYNLWVTVAAGSAVFSLRNVSGGSLSEAVVINFAIIKGATS